MDSVPANDWTARELWELIAFFAWMDALCAEATRQGQKAPWPAPDRVAEGLNYWIMEYGRGLTPAQALVHYYRSAPLRQAGEGGQCLDMAEATVSP